MGCCHPLPLCPAFLLPTRCIIIHFSSLPFPAIMVHTCACSYSAADVLLYLMGLVVFPAGVATWLVLSLARACNDAKTFLWNACTNMVWQSSRQIHMQAKPMQHAGPASSDKQQ